MKNTKLKITLWGKEIGMLIWDSKNGNSIFAYNPNFIDSGLDIAPIMHSIESPMARYPIFGEKGHKYQNLPPFLADSLPESWGNKVFEQWARENGIRGHQLTSLEKLAFIGRRGMGALEYHPEVKLSEDTENLQLQKLAKLAEDIYNQKNEETILQNERLTLNALYQIGGSVGGRQPKALIAINETTGAIRSGQTSSDPGFTHYIMKFDVDNEFLHPATVLEMIYYRMATLAGISMMPSKFFKLQKRQHFLTERFDRRNGEKIHTQSLAAMNIYAESYEDLFKTARKINLDKTEMQQLYRQMVFNFLAGNTDDHSKNFKFIMDKNGKWSLSPAFDLTFTQTRPDGRSAHVLTMKGKATDVTVQDLIQFAKEEGIANAQKTINEVADAISQFRKLCTEYKLFGFWPNFIERELYALAPETHKEKLTQWKAERIKETVINGIVVKNIHAVPTEKRNVHLYATIDGKEIKYIFGKKRKEIEILMNPQNSEEYINNIKKMIEIYIVPKYQNKTPKIS